MSYSYFCHTFRQIVSMSFSEYLLSVRLMAAERMLLTENGSITAIAQATGKNYAIGPYRGEAAPAAGQEPKESDPVEALLQNARAAGIPIEMK